MALKVLMVGGRRCGKTSALASTFDQMINGPVKDYFTVADKTNYDTKVSDNGLENQDVLSDKQLELESKLESPTDELFLTDNSRTLIDFKYVLQLIVPGTRKSMDIEFTDVPGEWFAPRAGNAIIGESGFSVREKVTGMIQDTDVFIIMVDTPYLMHEKESVAKATNAIAGIHDYMTHVGGEKEKLVIFSIIKCEKWVKEGKMNQVVEKLKKLYATTIQALMAFDKMNICIIPIETAGNILFFEYSEPFILVDSAGKPQRCKKINDSMARLGNGDIYFLEGNEVFNPDGEAKIFGKTCRPYTWYHINPKPSTSKLYAPHNCDQIPLHIIEFMLNKMIKENPGHFWGFLWEKIFGGISKETLQTKISEMKSKGIIKNNVDHIEYLKRSN